MTKLNKFLGDDTGAVTIDWVALTAGILLLGIMVIYAIFNGGVAGLVSNVNATLAAVITDVDTGDAPDLNGIDVASASFSGLLSDGSSMPLGAVSTGSGLFSHNTVLTQFTLPGSEGFFQVHSAVGTPILAVGTTVSGESTFTSPDGTTTTSSQAFLDSSTMLSDPFSLGTPPA